MSQQTPPPPPTPIFSENEPYYHGLLPREDVRLLLIQNGDFVLRMSESKSGDRRAFVLSVMYNSSLADENQAMKHFIVKFSHHGYTLNDTNKFETIPRLIDFHLKNRGSLPGEVSIIRPIMRQSWELDHDTVTINRKLGEGAFGEVSMGEYKPKSGGKTIKVAVKQAKLDKISKEQIKEFMSEARMMRPLNHPNVVRFYGVAAGREPLYMVMELADGGSLDSYLKKNDSFHMEMYNEMVVQAAWGLEYLHTKNIIHRDIAARNCLYGDRKVKISDFGMSRHGPTYIMDSKKIVPLRWLALETIRSYLYTPKTDIWSFGVLAWEIYNKGAEPYPGMSVAEVHGQVQRGYRMTFPQDVSPDVAKVLTEKCWSEDPNERFSMSELAQFLQTFFGIHRPVVSPATNNNNREVLLGSRRKRVKASPKHRKKLN